MAAILVAQEVPAQIRRAVIRSVIYMPAATKTYLFWRQAGKVANCCALVRPDSNLGMSDACGNLIIERTAHEALLSRTDRDRLDHRRWVKHASVRNDDDSLPGRRGA